MRALMMAVAISAPAAAQAPSPAAAATAAAVERLLVTMGGRETWAGVRAYRVDAIHDTANGRRESTIWVDFARPRTRTESRAPGSLRVVVLDGERVQRRRDGDTAPPNAATIAAEREWWRTNVYRTIHRLAVRDPALTAYLTETRLAVFERGEPLLWIRLNPDGSPAGFGADFTAPGTVFGPLRPFGAVRVPASSTRNDGTWRASVTGFEPNPDLSAVAFDQP